MDKKLIAQAITKLLSGILFIAVLLFASAGTVRYWNGWLFMGILFIPMSIIGIVLMVKAPELLRKRLNRQERELRQKDIIALSGLMFISGFIIAGLNFRFKWLMLPNWAVIVGAIVFLFAYLLYAEVLRENTYLSRTVEIQQNQQVVSTGLYGVVRHPMYSSTILLFLSIPFILGSLFSFVIFLVYPILIVLRIKNEESVLEAGLEGYAAYKKSVKYKVIPFIW